MIHGKKLLLTGASGFIGRHALRGAAAAGYEVHAVARREPPELAAEAHWHRCDLFDGGQVSQLIEQVRPSHLLHFAWYAEPGKYWTSPENYRWVRASLELLAEFRRQGGRRVVVAGTCAEYDWRHGTCSEARTPLAPTTTYGACKNQLREQLEAFCAASPGLSGAWGRIFFTYGPHEHPARLVASVIRALLAGRTARCTHGEQIRDFLHVEDVARAFVALVDSDVAGAVNVASGQPVAVKDIVLGIADRLDARDRVELGALPAPAGEIPVLLADIERLRGEVGWEPMYNLDQGLDRTIAYWKDQPREEPCA